MINDMINMNNQWVKVQFHKLIEDVNHTMVRTLN